MIISGAFGMFRRDVVVEVGGLDNDCIGEDFELVTRIHRPMREEQRDYRVVFVAEPVSWTEVPPTRAVLASQRRRWHRGLWEMLWKHRGDDGNAAYGRIGLVGAAVLTGCSSWSHRSWSCSALVIVPLGLLLGVVNLSGTPCCSPWFAYGYAILVTLAAMPRWRSSPSTATRGGSDLRIDASPPRRWRTSATAS